METFELVPLIINIKGATVPSELIPSRVNKSMGGLPGLGAHSHGLYSNIFANKRPYKAL